MAFYQVKWVIELEATCPEHAATLAREIQLDPESTATVFQVGLFGRNDAPGDVDVAELAD